MTAEEYLEQLAACDFAQSNQVSKLITSSYTNVGFDAKVLEYQLTNPLGAQNFFAGFFGTEVWADGQGDDRIREYATDPYIPTTFSHFVKQVQLCDPNTGDRCNQDFCQIPEGGRGTLPPQQWYTWGFETPRTCIANFRHIRDFQYWGARTVRGRAMIDEKIMYQFYVFAALRTAGHKYTLNGTETNGMLTYAANTNPRGKSQYGSFNFLQDNFPAVTNPNTLMPLTYPFLEALARRFEAIPEGNAVGKNSRGGDVFEIWYPDDFWQENVLTNPDYMNSLKYTMPNSLFAGYSLKPGDAEIIGNWKFRIMPNLPRFAPTADGQVVEVQTHIEVPIEVGNEPLPSIEWMNAPIGVAMMVHGRQGTILTRPTLSHSIDGIPIQPISSNTGWVFNNEYDPTCNRLKNMPFSYKSYNMGFRIEDPNAATAFLFRRRLFAMQPIANCDLQPMVLTTPYNNTCPISTVGCQDGKERVSDNITQIENPPLAVNCFTVECTNAGGTTLVRIKINRRTHQEDFNSLGCGCGDAVTLYVYDDEGVYLRQVQGIVRSTMKGFPYAEYLIQVANGAIDTEAGECVKRIICADSAPLNANAIASYDSTIEGYEDVVGLVVTLDAPIGCEVGDDVFVRYYDENGLVLATVSGASVTIVEFDIDSNTYRITGDAGLKALGNPAVTAGTAYIGVSCNQSPNASSSSSGS